MTSRGHFLPQPFYNSVIRERTQPTFVGGFHSFVLRDYVISKHKVLLHASKILVNAVIAFSINNKIYYPFCALLLDFQLAWDCWI